MDHIKFASALGAATAQAKFAAENLEAAKKKKGGGMSGTQKALLAALLGAGALGGGALGAHMMTPGGLSSLLGEEGALGYLRSLGNRIRIPSGLSSLLGGEVGSTAPSGDIPASLESGAIQTPAALNGLPSGYKGNPSGLMEAIQASRGGVGTVDGQPIMSLPPGQRGQDIQALSNILGNPVPGQ